jgi:hypothetical protein
MLPSLSIVSSSSGLAEYVPSTVLAASFFAAMGRFIRAFVYNPIIVVGAAAATFRLSSEVSLLSSSSPPGFTHSNA